MVSDKNVQIDPLWKRICSGDKEAFKLLHRLYHNRLLQYGSFFTKNRSETEDVIQELFILLWEQRRKIETRNLETYLFVAFKNNMLLHRRRELTRKNNSDSYASGRALQELTVEEHIISTEMESNQKHILFEEIDRLPERQQEVIFLRYYQDLSYKEIAEIMEIDYQTARNFATRALKKLRQHIARFDEILYLLLSIIFLA